LHDAHPEGEPYDAMKVSNEVAERIFLPLDPDTAFAAYFGHLSGYDAGYYGYAWADAIAADLATVFEKSKDGFLDKPTGMRLRNEIYAVGDSRDVEQSVEKFLGRKRSLEPFLKSLGIGGKKATAGPSNESR
jgi:thimet oligopeptidase